MSSEVRYGNPGRQPRQSPSTSGSSHRPATVPHETDPECGHCDVEMEILGKEIRRNLRLGDVYTQYSSCQYLIMVSDVIDKYIDVIADRMREAYYRYHEDGTDNIMLHSSYPLRPEI